MTFRSMAAVAVLAAFSLAAAGCGPRATNTTTTETTNTTTAAGDTTTTTTTTTTAAAGNIPAQCQAYIDAVTACTDHLGASNPAVATQVRQQMDQTRAQWSNIQDQAALAQACTTATNAWNGMKGAMGC